MLINSKLKIFNLILISFTLIIIFSNKALSNISMPGFWNVGTGRTIIPIYNQKELYEISMEKEFINVHLYKNFAVVKGEYYMKNNSNKSIKINIGYPETGFFVNKKVENVIFNNLEKLQIVINKENINFKTVVNDNKDKSWYVWETNFEPNSVKKITVYYIVNTNNARIKKGYDSDFGNGFAYILESGKIWKDRIKEGLVAIKLMENLNINDLYGVFPENQLKYDEEKNYILYKFSNLEPTEDNNIIIRYSSNKDNFNFDKITNNYSYYYKILDTEVSNINLNDIEKLPTINKNNFKPFPYTLVFFSVLFLISIIFILVFLKLIVFRFRKKTKKL